ncbi:MAG TPA: hypothetical protein VFI73_08280 [Candidatus Nitrosopolaris sp.]|nr:hypothetical protein [Candidatus Nitrosopolaris sp.]
MTSIISCVDYIKSVVIVLIVVISDIDKTLTIIENVGFAAGSTMIVVIPGAAVIVVTIDGNIGKARKTPLDII